MIVFSDQQEECKPNKKTVSDQITICVSNYRAKRGKEQHRMHRYMYNYDFGNNETKRKYNETKRNYNENLVSVNEVF